jgi:two-component system heavy metal sensor histidine kinase CusS
VEGAQRNAAYSGDQPHGRPHPVNDVGRTDSGARLPAELAGLAETFNSMLDRLEQSFLHISHFSDDVAHELRTPINNLRGEIEVALSNARPGDEYREILGSCLEECTRISRLIQTLLFLARSDTTADALQREKIDVGCELRKVEEFYRAAATDAGVVLRVCGPAGEGAEVNRALFQQAVGNLVSNAIAHTPPGGTITVNARADERQLTVSVSDTGCGIPREHLPRVFERFDRVDRVRTNSGQNVGLGLAVVKSIATRHGGHVDIDSEVGRSSASGIGSNRSIGNRFRVCPDSSVSGAYGRVFAAAIVPGTLLC